MFNSAWNVKYLRCCNC